MSFQIDLRRCRDASCDSARLTVAFLQETNGRNRATFSEFLRLTDVENELLARKVFDALGSDSRGDITLDDYVNAGRKLCSSHDSDDDERLRFLFSILDLDGDGAITKADLETLLSASTEEEGRQMTDEERTQYVATLLELFEVDGASSAIRYRTFRSVLQTYPSLSQDWTFGRLGAKESALSGPPARKRFRWARKAVSWIVNHPQWTFTCTLLLLLHVNLFTYVFFMYTGNCDGVDMDLPDPMTGYSREDLLRIAEEAGQFRLTVEGARYTVLSAAMAKYDPMECRDARRRRLFGWTFPVAKGCAEALKATFTLILLPVSRNLMTTLRDTILKHLFPFDEAIELHKYLGRVGFVLSWIHTICHIIHIFRWQDPKYGEAWCYAFPQDRAGSDVTEVTHDEIKIRLLANGGVAGVFCDGEGQPQLKDILKTPTTTTGIVLIAIYTFVSLFAFDYPKKLSIFSAPNAEGHRSGCLGAMGRCLNDFNHFWYSHHLLIVFYAVLLIHPLPDLPDKHSEQECSEFWIWVSIPLVIYLLERVVQAKRGTESQQIVDAQFIGNEIVRLCFRRPRGFTFTPGQFIYIRCPEISRFEWHPFTLTSCPREADLSVLIRKAGDWTTALYDLVKGRMEKDSNLDSSRSISSRRCGEQTMDDEVFGMSVSINGPFGSSAQDYAAHRVIVLIGFGIGIAPFLCIVKGLLDTLKRCACRRCGYCNPYAMPTRVEKVYVYWTVQSREEASWFQSTLEEILHRDEDLLLDIQIHVAGIEGAIDIRTMLLCLAQYESSASSRSDRISRTMTRFGRVNWKAVFERVKTDFPDEPLVGVFYCGPNTTAKIIDKMCRMNSKGTTGFLFRKESFWSTSDAFASE